MDKSFNITISAFIAISIYVLVLLLFILYTQNPIVKKYQAIAKDTVIELDIIVNERKKIDKKNNEKKVIPKKEDIKIENSSSSSAIKKTNLKSLFANVSTKSINIEEEKVLNVKKNEISSRFKSKYKKNKNKSELKISKLDDIKSTKKIKKIITRSKGEFDEYYSKINSLILSRWYKYPLYTKEEYLVKVEITISLEGSFSYNINSFSGNLNIDNAVKEFLKTQVGKIYPIPLDKKEKKIIINFINDKA